MSIATLILGESGSGKSASMRSMDPSTTLLIQSIRKPLPFRSSAWQPVGKGGGNILVTDDHERIIGALHKTSRDVIIIDDFQYVLANEFMRRSQETGFTKFTEIGRHAWDIINAAANLADHKRVYIMSHTDSDQEGRVKIKTIGKMLDEKITVEGMFTIVLRTQVSDGKYGFSTQNNGADTVKSPMGLFDSSLIDNDLSAVDAAICEYYGLANIISHHKETAA